MGEAIIARRGGGGKAKEPTNWSFLQAFSSNGTFQVQGNTWYRIHVYGCSGRGGNTYQGGYTAGNSGAGGGGSGGYSCSVLYFKAGVAVPITATPSTTSFGTYLSATAGTQGEDVMEYTEGYTAKAGVGGQGYGGNQINVGGFAGGSGGRSGKSKSSPGTAGLNLGGAGGAGSSSNYGNVLGGGGGGGGRLANSPYTISNMSAYAGGRGWNIVPAGNDSAYIQATNGVTLPGPHDTLPPKVYGGGGGAGGGGSRIDVYGAVGTPAIIIIEKGV